MLIAFLAVAVVLVAFGGLLAALASALFTLSRTDLVELGARSRTRRSLLGIAADVGAHTNAIVFMRVISETTAAVLVTLAFASILPWWWALLVAALIMVAVSFVLVGSSPRSVGSAHARGLIAFSAPLVRTIRVVLGPVADGLVLLGDRVTPGRRATQSFSSEEQLLSMVDEAAEADVLEQDDRELIHSIFEFSDTVVREVMVPRPDMVTVDDDETAEEAMGVLLARGISRVPVVGKDTDDVLGVLYLRDIARLGFERPTALAESTAAALARPALFVPESKKADDTLRLMQRESNHLALVVDEYGVVAGLVTLEDLIEELVGEISDEYDREVPDFEAVADGVYRVAVRMPVDELGDLFGLELEDEDVDSVGGLLAKQLGRLPVSGSRAEAGGLILTAERTEGRRHRVTSVLVERSQELIDAERAFDEERQAAAGDDAPSETQRAPR